MTINWAKMYAKNNLCPSWWQTGNGNSFKTKTQTQRTDKKRKLERQLMFETHRGSKDVMWAASKKEGFANFWIAVLRSRGLP